MVAVGCVSCYFASGRNRGGCGGEDGGLEQDVGFTEAQIEIRVYVSTRDNQEAILSVLASASVLLIG